MANKKTVEIVIPIFNEEKELNESIKKLHQYLTKNLTLYQWQITIADNASTDKSHSIARTLSQTYQNVTVIHLDKKGRGRAVKKAWRQSSKDICVYMDVDLSTDLKSLPSLLSHIQSGYDIAIASRLKPKSKVVGRPFKREILSRVYNILIRLLFQTKFLDAQCGFKAVNKKVVEKLLPHIKDNAWFFDSELLIIGEKVGCKIYEEPVLWVDNPGSTVRVLKTVYGDLKGLWILFWTKPWSKIRYE